MIFLDLQLPLGKNTLWPLTVISDFGSEAITWQHWHLLVVEKHLVVPPPLMPRDIFFNTDSFDPILGAVFLVKLKFTCLSLKLLVFCKWGIASFTQFTSKLSVPYVETIRTLWTGELETGVFLSLFFMRTLRSRFTDNTLVLIRFTNDLG